LSVNESLIAAYVFCCNGNEGEVLVFGTPDSFDSSILFVSGVLLIFFTDVVPSPALILKRLIATILSAFPNITISHVAKLPLNRFQEVNDSGLKAWELLAESK
jgi:hypothetical protein